MAWNPRKVTTPIGTQIQWTWSGAGPSPAGTNKIMMWPGQSPPTVVGPTNPVPGGGGYGSPGPGGPGNTWPGPNTPTAKPKPIVTPGPKRIPGAFPGRFGTPTHVSGKTPWTTTNASPDPRSGGWSKVARIRRIQQQTLNIPQGSNYSGIPPKPYYSGGPHGQGGSWGHGGYYGTRGYQVWKSLVGRGGLGTTRTGVKPSGFLLDPTKVNPNDPHNGLLDPNNSIFMMTPRKGTGFKTHPLGLFGANPGSGGGRGAAPAAGGGGGAPGPPGGGGGGGPSFTIAQIETAPEPTGNVGLNGGIDSHKAQAAVTDAGAQSVNYNPHGLNLGFDSAGNPTQQTDAVIPVVKQDGKPVGTVNITPTIKSTGNIGSLESQVELQNYCGVGQTTPNNGTYCGVGGVAPTVSNCPPVTQETNPTMSNCEPTLPGRTPATTKPAGQRAGNDNSKVIGNDEEEAMLEEFFNSFDTDGDGYITESEWRGSTEA